MSEERQKSPSPCPSPTGGEGTKTAAAQAPSPLAGEGGPQGRVRGEGSEAVVVRSAERATGTEQEARSERQRATGTEVVRVARTWERTPYRHQGSVKGVACDCLGLARGVWREVYAGADPETVPAYSPDWAEASGQETLLEAARRHMLPVAEGRDPEAVLAAAEPGDLLIMRWRPHLPAKHCAILTERGADRLPFGWRIIHAYDAAKRVAEVPLAPQWRKLVVAAFRFPLLASRSGLRPSSPLDEGA